MRQQQNAVFDYKSACCSARAEKEPCQRKPSDKKEAKWSQSTLGTWRCSRCKRVCVCTRSKAA